MDVKRLALLLYILTLTFFATACSTDKQFPVANKGILDLSGWNLEQQGIVALDGEWEFYFQQLLSAKDFPRTNAKNYVSQPAAWNEIKSREKTLPAYGYATYRLQIKNATIQQPQALRISKVLSAYTIWINGELHASSGQTGISKQQEVPKLSLEIIEFNPQQSTIEIIIQVSNHHYRGGGIAKSIDYGTAQQIRKAQNYNWAFSIFIASGLSIMAGYHFILFLLRRRDLSALYLGIFCILWTLNTVFSSPSGWIISFLLPQLSWPDLYRVGISAYYLSIPVLLMFLSALYPAESNRFIQRFYQLLAGLFFAGSLFLPIDWVVEIAPVYHFFSFILIPYLMINLYKSIIMKREGALIILAGLTILVVAGANDMLHDSGLIDSQYLFYLGLFIYILFQSLVLSRRFSNALNTVEKLSTELIQKNAELSRLDKLKDEFLANTSHELRTPLHGIIGLCESLIKDSGQGINQTADNSLKMVSDSAKRLAALVNDILDFSRLNHKDLSLKLEALDIHTMTDIVLMLSRQSARQKSIQLLNNIPQNLPMIMADSDRLQQILYNLVGNAIKYTERGQVEITAWVQGGNIQVCVSDTGIGIEKSKLELIFKPFENISPTTMDQPESCGLGLGLSRKLVELHGGTLTVDSTPGKGSQFCFTLPCNQQQHTSLLQQQDKPAEHLINQQYIENTKDLPEKTKRTPLAGAEFNILAIDDDPINLQVVIEYLNSDGINVVTACSGRQGLQKIDQGGEFDLILLDILMPGMNGFDVCKSIRKRFSIAELPIIILTARNHQQDLVLGLNSGANDYLKKPYTREELLARIHAQLNVTMTHKAIMENRRLNTEIQQRRLTEHGLRATQQRLNALLDSVPEALIAINQDEEINFSNRNFEKITGHASSQLLGKSLINLFSDNSIQWIRNCLQQMRKNTDIEPHQLQLQYSNNSIHQHCMEAKALELEEEQLLILVIKSANGTEQMIKPSNALLLIESLNQNRVRLQTLEEALNGYTPQLLKSHPDFINILHDIDSVFRQLTHSLSCETMQIDKRLSIINIMKLVVEYWEQSTKSGKAELARRSALWKVYTNEDGWDRTQTMDRYFSLQTLPKHPRFKQVIRTADYVLANCQLDNELRQKIEVALLDLQQNG